MIRRGIFIAALVSAAAFTGCQTEAGAFRDYMMNAGQEYEDTLVLDYSERYDEVRVYDSSEVTGSLLEGRQGLLIERCEGKVINSVTGEGRLLNGQSEAYSYISYKGVEGISDGMLMVTYLVYDPETDGVDDIIARYDCKVKEG